MSGDLYIQESRVGVRGTWKIFPAREPLTLLLTPMIDKLQESKKIAFPPRPCTSIHPMKTPKLHAQDPSSTLRLGDQERGASSSACMASNALTATTASPPSAALAATSDRTACCSVSSAERAAWYRVGFCACSAARAMGPLHQLLARVSRKTTQLRGSMVDRAATTHWPTSSRSARTSRTDPAERPTGSRRSSPSRRRRTRLIVRRAEPTGGEARMSVLSLCRR